jgi:hypothetical protein
MTAFDKQIGPRVVGGRYYSSYSDATYLVLQIDTHRNEWPLWQMTVRRVGDGKVFKHSTNWNPDRDRLIPSPTGA